MIPDLSARANLQELMDDPKCDETQLLRTVRQFSSINRLTSRYRKILTQWVLDDMHPGREYHLIDMGAGGCDIDAWLLRIAHKRGLTLRITACDIDPRIIAYARSTYGNLPNLEIKEVNLLDGSFSEPVDYVFANHFLHHLTNQEITRLFQRWTPLVRRRMVFSDLQRSPYAYFGFSLLALFYRNSFARTDGLLSIRRGFLPHDLEALAHSVAFSTQKLPPGRLVFCIDGNSLY